MKIKSINIQGYKSIKELTIPLQSYGDGENKSQTVFLVGVNESGKSNILEAIGLLTEYDIGFLLENPTEYRGDYGKDFHKGSEEGGEIRISADIELTDMDGWKKCIVEKISCLKNSADAIQIVKLEKCIYIKNDGTVSGKYNIEINDDFPFSQYKVCNKKIVEAVESSDHEAKLLTKKYLEYEIADSLTESEYFHQKMPQMQHWPYKSLLKDDWDLIDKPVNSLHSLFRNLFLIYGKNTDDEIKQTIAQLGNPEKRQEFEKKMSKTVTDYINGIWKNHDVEISVIVVDQGQEMMCEVRVKDNGMDGSYSMSQRSDGFKQFISLLLSLSAKNKGGELKNNIILLDEPEQYLHPSAIKNMRKELINLGKNNPVIVATHSNYMIDVNVPERHFLVKKENGETQLAKIDDFYDDEVLYPAFGLNFFKELLPENIILVEGESDRIIFSHAIRLFRPALSYSVKHTEGSGNCPNHARILSREKIKTFIIFDADDGSKKTSIITDQADYYSDKNVFTLKDLLNSSQEKSLTIEDLLPPDEYSLEKFKDDKISLAQKFCEDHKEKRDIECKASKLKEVIENLCKKIEKFSHD